MKIEILAIVTVAAAWSVFSLLRFHEAKLANSFYYVVPIIPTFVSLIFDRLRRLEHSSRVQTAIDAAVLLTSMWRVIGDVPYVSGHSLFLTYALLTTRGRFRRLIAAIVLTEVLVLKIFFWNDWITFAVGVVLASVAFLIRSSFQPHESERDLSEPPAVAGG